MKLSTLRSTLPSGVTGTVLAEVLYVMCRTNSVSDEDVIPSLSPCDSEFLPLYIDNLRLLVICFYPPVWNNISYHYEAISAIIQIIDTILSSPMYHPDCNIVLCGDFNDLHKFKVR